MIGSCPASTQYDFMLCLCMYVRTYERMVLDMELSAFIFAFIEAGRHRIASLRNPNMGGIFLSCLVFRFFCSLEYIEHVDQEWVSISISGCIIIYFGEANSRHPSSSSSSSGGVLR